jgi:hypothetical protein
MPKIERPCPKSWSELAPDSPTTRACAQCRERVHDLAAMGPVDAARLLRRGGACVRAVVAPGGRLVTLPVAALWLAGAASPASPVVPTCPEWWADLTEAAVLFGWRVEVQHGEADLADLRLLGYVTNEPLVPTPAHLALAPGEPVRPGVVDCDDGPRLLVFEPGAPIDVADCWKDTEPQGTARCVAAGSGMSCSTVSVKVGADSGLTAARCWGEPAVPLTPGAETWVPVGPGCALQVGGDAGFVDVHPVVAGDAVRCWALAAGGFGCT